MSGSRNFKKVVLVGVVCALMVGGLSYGTEKPARRGLLGTIPGDSLFCVRIGRLEGTLDTAGDFLKGVAPEPFDAKEAVFKKLGSLLGNEKLAGVNLVVHISQVPEDQL